jgi:hypothetical protein
MHSHPTMIGCPACAGCLCLEEDPHGHKQFMCSVGHAFSLWEIYESKEAELERAQWSTVALYKHLEMILGMLLESPCLADPREASTIRRRLTETQQQAASVQKLIESTRLPAFPPAASGQSPERRKVER